MSGVRVTVCVGGGGVGKTTMSAALATSLAIGGERTLLVTIDPARRLAGALGVPLSHTVTPVSVAGAKGQLAALMPDPRLSMPTFVDILFAGAPEARARILANRLYQGLADAAAGVHEIVAMTLVADAAATGRWDAIVVDTAPSRHAIDFITYPGRLASLLGGRAVGWLAGLAARAEAPRRRGLFSAVTGRVDGLLGRVLGPNLLRDTAALFEDLALVRERFVGLSEVSSELLLGAGTRYLVIAAPTAASRADVDFLAARLRSLGREPAAIVVNRAETDPGDWLQELARERSLGPSVAELVRGFSVEFAGRSLAADQAVAALERAYPSVPVLRFPHIEAASPSEVVAALVARWVRSAADDRAAAGAGPAEGAAGTGAARRGVTF